MSKERFAERQTAVRASAARLAEAVAQPESELIRDATIQRFELTFEVVWKTLKLSRTAGPRVWRAAPDAQKSLR